MGTGEAGVYYTSGGSNRVHHQALIHSIDGVFTHDPRTGRPRKMRSGGHGQANIDLLTQYGFTFHIDKVYPNGVRRGRVTGHAAKRKRAAPNRCGSQANGVWKTSSRPVNMSAD